MTEKDIGAVAEELQRVVIDQEARAQQNRKLLDAWGARNRASLELLRAELEWIQRTRAEAAIGDDILRRAKQLLGEVLLQLGGTQCSCSPGR